MRTKHVPSLHRNGAMVVVLIAFAFLVASCKQDTNSATPTTVTPNNPTPISTSIPKAPSAIDFPVDNPQTSAKVELGRRFFFDKQMSVDGTTSCGSCHKVQNGFSDIFPNSIGMGQQHGNRNAPALANIAYNTSFTWDGKFASLEQHAPGPIFNSLEMGNNFTSDPGSQDSVPSGYNSKPGNDDTLFLFARLDGLGSRVAHKADQYSKRRDINGNNYYTLMMSAWNTNVFSMDLIAKSIAAFERTFISTQSDFDKYNNGDQTVFKYNPEAIHGLQLFTDVNGANCVSCHSGYNFTDQQFHDNGIGINQQGDKGRFGVTKDQSDIGKFKTPSLRNVSLTAPYMHDGHLATLESVLKNYNSGGIHSANQDPKIRTLNLSDQDISDIIEFLKTLTDYSFVTDKAQRYTNPWGN